MLSLYGDNPVGKVQSCFAPFSGPYSWLVSWKTYFFLGTDWIELLFQISGNKVTGSDLWMVWWPEEMRGRSNYWNPETERAIRLSEIFSHGCSKPTMTPQREAWEINNPISLFSPPDLLWGSVLAQLNGKPNGQESQGDRFIKISLWGRKQMGAWNGYAGQMANVQHSAGRSVHPPCRKAI